MDLKRLERVNDKMNKITQEITKNIKVSEDILTTTQELEDYLKEKQVLVPELVDHNEQSQDAKNPVLAPVQEIAANVVDINAMREDFFYMRQMLRNTTESSKRVLESITEELTLSDSENRAGLVLAYSELNKAQIESVKLFMQSYREVSTILVNLAKVSNSGVPNTVHTTNVLNIEDKSHVSSADIINRLRGQGIPNND